MYRYMLSKDMKKRSDKHNEQWTKDRCSVKGKLHGMGYPLPSGLLAVVRSTNKFMNDSVNVLKYSDSFP